MKQQTCVRESLQHFSSEELIEQHTQTRLPYAVCCFNRCATANTVQIEQAAAQFGCSAVYYVVNNQQLTQENSMREFQTVNLIAFDVPKNPHLADPDLENDLRNEIAIRMLESHGWQPFLLDHTGHNIACVDFATVERPCIVIPEDSQCREFLQQRLPTVSLANTGIFHSVNTETAAAVCMSTIQNALSQHSIFSCE